MQKLIRVLFCLSLAGVAQAQERFSLFVGSPHEDVQRMLKIVGLRDGDVVFDLGSGDGRVVLEAARLNPKVRGRGIEIDEKLVRESAAAAKSQGVADRVQFLHQDAFDADLSEATVIAMWLFPELMRMLRPKILAQTAPGTRVVARTWDLGSWKPDSTDVEGPVVNLWIVPAKVEGYWTWSVPFKGAVQTYSAVMEQRFQEAEGVVRAGGNRGILEDVKLNGREISFTLTMTLAVKGAVTHRFNGAVQGDAIEGAVSVLYKPNEKPYELPWRAVRTHDPAYFAPSPIGPK